jgi:hypothetical protein
LQLVFEFFDEIDLVFCKIMYHLELAPSSLSGRGVTFQSGAYTRPRRTVPTTEGAGDGNQPGSGSPALPQF